VTWVRAAVVFALLAFSFHVRGPGDFISWAFGVLAAIVIGVPFVQRRSDFAPFWVRIWPTRAFLTETGLATEERVKKMEEGLRATDGEASFGWYLFHGYNRPQHPSEHSFLRDGVWFTVLRPDNFDQSGLVFWNEFGVFTTAIKQTLELAELSEPMGPNAAIPDTPFNPRLYLEPGGGGLSLRVATVREILDTYEGLDPGRAVAVLPRAEFRGYGWWQDAKKMQKKRDEQLAKLGWTREPAEDHWLRLGAPHELHHKYFKIEWRYI